MALEIHLLTWDRHKNKARLNRSMGHPIDNWISDNKDINKQFQNPVQIRSHSKDHIQSQNKVLVCLFAYLVHITFILLYSICLKENQQC